MNTGALPAPGPSESPRTLTPTKPGPPKLHPAPAAKKPQSTPTDSPIKKLIAKKEEKKAEKQKRRLEKEKKDSLGKEAKKLSFLQRWKKDTKK